VALLAVLALSCAGALRARRPMAPEPAGAGAWERLEQLRSFRFALWFHTDMPLPIEVRFSGVRERSDREAWSGYMRRRTELTKVELRAEGSEQYERQASGWRRAPRGIETRVLEQGGGVFHGSRLEFIGSAHGRYRFAFKPDLPILDPTLTKRLSGVMEVEPGYGLPVRIYCSDSAKTAEWELRLSRYNRAGSVVVPYEPAMTIDASPARRLSRADFSRAVATIEVRLAKLGWEYRLRRTAKGLALLLGQPKPRRELQWLFSRGSVEVWQGHWVRGGESTGAAAEVGGDASRRVVLEHPLAANEGLGAEVRAATPLAASLVTSIAAPDTSRIAILLLDSVALSTAGRAPDGGLQFEDIGNEDDVRVVAALATGGVIPADFTIAIRP